MTHVSRRSFVRSMIAVGAAPIVLGGCTATGFAANRKVRIGVIGLGRIASTFEIPCVLARKDIARIVAVMIAMGEKNKLQLILTPVIWCVFTYFVFDRLLFISLPIGSLFKGIL